MPNPPGDRLPVRPIRHHYALRQILDTRRTLRDAIDQGLHGEVITGRSFRRLVQIASEVLPSTVDPQALEDSLRPLAGKGIDPAELDTTCWRLAGNVPRLRKGRTALPWRVQPHYEWVPLQILSCRTARGPFERIGARFTFRVMAGTPCPLILSKWWSRELCRFHAQEFGFSGRQRGHQSVPRPYAVQEQIVGLRLYALIEPKLCDREPGFRVLGWPPSVRDWNLEVIRRRLRLEAGYTCPKGFPTAFQCQKCPIGYVTCPAATHRHPWTKQPCRGCGLPAAWFDLEVNADLCVDCTVLLVYKRE